MTWISDGAVSRLRAIAEEPDFRGTRYTIVRELARGGMGVVYEAEDAELQRRVAIKVVATELAVDDAAERMRREARVIAKLEHPGIVPLHDVGALPDGRIFYAMKLVRGHRLDERPLARTEALRLFLRLCEAVAFAHANGVVHCDLKPANVMVGAFGEVLVMDWGVARAIGESSPQFAIGTRGYMLDSSRAGLRRAETSARSHREMRGTQRTRSLRERRAARRRSRTLPRWRAVTHLSRIDHRTRNALAREQPRARSRRHRIHPHAPRRTFLHTPLKDFERTLNQLAGGNR